MKKYQEFLAEIFKIMSVEYIRVSTIALQLEDDVPYNGGNREHP